MGTIQEKLAYLNNTKTLIRNAIIDKGVPVSASDTFRSYAEKIGLIQGGSSGGAALNLGPYAEPVWNYSFTNPQSTYPNMSADFQKPADYVWPEDWWNIEEILDQDAEDYPAKMIVLYPNNVKSTTLYGANFYRTSDGTTYTSTGLTQSQEHVWDTSFDKIGQNGMGYRYVISYFSSNKGVNYFQQSNNTVNSNAIAIITKGFRWQQTTASSSNSVVGQRPFNGRYDLRYVKTKDSDWSDISVLSGWFAYCYSLEYVELDFNNGISIAEAPKGLNYMFCHCRSLKYAKFSMPARTDSCAAMFQDCKDLSYMDIDWTHKITGTPCSCSNMFLYSGITNATMIFNPRQDTLWQPWVQLKSNDPLKVSKIVYKNARDNSSSGIYQNYVTRYPALEIEVEASNDGENWTSMGLIKPKLWTQLAETSVDIDPTDAYMYWRFRATKLANSYFTAQRFIFTAQYEKTTMEGNEEVKTWVDWAQPNFTAAVQDNCEITCSESNSASYPSYYAFNNSDAYNNYWMSTSSSSSGRCIDFNQMFRDCSSLNTVYIKGGNKITWYDCRDWDAKYIIFENTDSVTSFASTFACSGHVTSKLLGCIIPNTENVTSWNKAFQYCVDMTVAPQIKISSKVTNVDQMFSSTKILDITHLDVSEAVHCHGLLSEINSGGFSEVNMEFPEATELSCLFYNNGNLARANIVAPKVRTLSQAFQGTSALKYAKVSGYNQEENANVLAKWSRPNLTSDTSYGELTYDPALRLNGSLYKIYDGRDYSTDYSDYAAFTGTGSIYWALPETVRLKINKIYLTSGYSLTLEGAFKGRFYADKEKSIPLTDEFTTDGSVWTTFEIPVTASAETRVSTIVLDVIENTGGRASIGEITFDAEYETSGYMTNLSSAFRDSSVAKVDLDGSKVKNYSYAFYNAFNSTSNNSSLLDIPDIGYESAENMSFAFCGQEKLTELNEIEFPVATNLNSAFKGCKGLISVDTLSLPECTTMSEAFSYCDSLGSVQQPSWPKVTDLSSAFTQCKYLKDLDLSNLELVANLESICSNSPNLAKAKVPETNSKTNMKNAFLGCSNLRQVTLGDMSKVTDLSYAFQDCSKLVSVSELALNSCTTLMQAFQNCSWLETISITNLDAVTTLREAFRGCTWLNSLSLPDMPQVTTLENAFRECSSLQSLTLKAMPKCTNATYMCQNCVTLSEVNLQDLSAVDNFSYGFQYCRALETITLPSTASVANFGYLFDGCSKLKSVSDLDTSNGVSFTCTFRNCLVLVASPIRSITSKATQTNCMYEGCKAIADWSFLDNFDVSGVIDMDYMFKSNVFSSLTIDKWNWNSFVQMPYMFDNNPNLETLTLDFKNINFSASDYNQDPHAYMFQNCPKLKTLNLLNTSGFSNFNHMFANTYFKEYTFNLENFKQGYFWAQGMFSDCKELESVIINYNNVSYTQAGSAPNYSIFYRIFQNCPKLKSVSLINVGKITNWFEAFAYVNNQEDCTINWNGAVINNPYLRGMFRETRSAGSIKHINMGAVEANPAINAIVGASAGYCAEPMYQEAQIDLKLPIDIQVQGLSFTQRSGVSDTHEFPNKARFYSDSECQVPISAEMVLDTAASSKADIEVSNVVTDRIVCKFGQELGRYIGAGLIGITAKAKGSLKQAAFTMPSLTSNGSLGGTSFAIACSSNEGGYPAYQACDGNPNTYWGPSSSNVPQSLTFYSPSPVKATKMNLFYRDSSGIYSAGTIQACNDGSSWADIGSWSGNSAISHSVEFDSISGYKYFKVNFTQRGGVGYGKARIEIEGSLSELSYYPWSTPESEDVQIIDFDISAVMDQIEVSSTPAKKTVWSSDNSQAIEMMYNLCQSEVYIPACLSNVAYRSYLNGISDSYIGNDNVPITIYDLDFYAPTSVGGTPTSQITGWFDRPSNIQKPTVLVNPKNIVNSIDLSALSLNRDSLLALFKGLMSRVGIAQATLTVGATNLNQLTAEDKKIATDKNWKLA